MQHITRHFLNKYNQPKNITNPCRICKLQVADKSGIQCKGKCACWAHFKCLGYSPQKILDIKDGKISIVCPCPNCDSMKKQQKKDLKPFKPLYPPMGGIYVTPSLRSMQASEPARLAFVKTTLPNKVLRDFGNLEDTAADEVARVDGIPENTTTNEVITTSNKVVRDNGVSANTTPNGVVATPIKVVRDNGISVDKPTEITRDDRLYGNATINRRVRDNGVFINTTLNKVVNDNGLFAHTTPNKVLRDNGVSVNTTTNEEVRDNGLLAYTMTNEVVKDNGVLVNNTRNEVLRENGAKGNEFSVQTTSTYILRGKDFFEPKPNKVYVDNGVLAKTAQDDVANKRVTHNEFSIQTTANKVYRDNGVYVMSTPIERAYNEFSVQTMPNKMLKDGGVLKTTTPNEGVKKKNCLEPEITLNEMLRDNRFYVERAPNKYRNNDFPVKTNASNAYNKPLVQTTQKEMSKNKKKMGEKAKYKVLTYTECSAQTMPKNFKG
ncbi:uncharacterized protein LOC128675814 [Plodia interpunctella]|uniref:uncharacterized protein LOC128675814 n=1 Tax=Plodia interpunctella TaxID=58824 RepID=UPI002367AF88|nr:uncharacterized protein LOC128675814 [Plodia interpunctella]XP_053611475.1 uncharacterized protein LOC128675814 [Plodia interpunctella]